MYTFILLTCCVVVSGAMAFILMAFLKRLKKIEDDFWRASREAIQAHTPVSPKKKRKAAEEAVAHVSSHA